MIDNYNKSIDFLERIQKATDLVERTNLITDAFQKANRLDRFIEKQSKLDRIPSIFKEISRNEKVFSQINKYNRTISAATEAFQLLEAIKKNTYQPLLCIDQSAFSTKRSRINIKNIYQGFLKVDYDLSEVETIEKNDAEEGIIRPALLITEVKEIKKIIAEIYRDHGAIFKLKPRQFEELIAELLDGKGYNVELTKQTRDGGFDILALSTGGEFPNKYLVECKRYDRKRRVGIDVIRSFCDVIQTENANKGIICTTTTFSTCAQERRKQIPYLLDFRDHDDIINWVKDYMSMR